LTLLDVLTRLSLLSLDQISHFWHQKFSHRVFNKIKKELSIFDKVEESYDKEIVAQICRTW